MPFGRKDVNPLAPSCTDFTHICTDFTHICTDLLAPIFRTSSPQRIGHGQPTGCAALDKHLMKQVGCAIKDVALVPLGTDTAKERNP